jgi:hypothetical protein
MVEEGPFQNYPNIFAGITVHLLMLATMCPYIVFACLTVILTFWIVTELLSFILTVRLFLLGFCEFIIYCIFLC